MTAIKLTNDVQAARAYLVSRRADTDALMQAGITCLPYAKVSPASGALPGGAVTVNGVVCASALCALAYILARYW